VPLFRVKGRKREQERGQYGHKDHRERNGMG